MQKLERAKSISSKDTASLSMWMEEEAPVPKEAWVNDIYSVFVRRGIEIPQIKTTICHIIFHRHDRRAVTDWRHMQWMKNQLVGEENEGVEIFPAESRLVDGANEYHMWVFEDPEFGFPFGFSTRIVSEKSVFGETQRKFPVARKPEDCDARNDELLELKRKIEDGKA